MITVVRIIRFKIRFDSILGLNDSNPRFESQIEMIAMNRFGIAMDCMDRLIQAILTILGITFF